MTGKALIGGHAKGDGPPPPDGWDSFGFIWAQSGQLQQPLDQHDVQIHNGSGGTQPNGTYPQEYTNVFGTTLQAGWVDQPAPGGIGRYSGSLDDRVQCYNSQGSGLVSTFKIDIFAGNYTLVSSHGSNGSTRSITLEVSVNDGAFTQIYNNPNWGGAAASQCVAGDGLVYSGTTYGPNIETHRTALPNVPSDGNIRLRATIDIQYIHFRYIRIDRA